MNSAATLLCIGFCLVTIAWLSGVMCQKRGSFDWFGRDNFDLILKKFDKLNDSPKRCKTMAKGEQFMPDDTVSQIPKYNNLPTEEWYRNRSSLIHLHNMALNRAYFFSFILQRLNATEDFQYNPDWYYYYMSTTADVHASNGFINGSAVFFDTNSTYANWFRTLPFNTTLELFGPKTWKSDDWRDPGNWQREPSLTTATIKDYGGMGANSNYTHPNYKMNPWYKLWLPDSSASMDSLNKFTYSVGIKYSNMTGHFTDNEFKATAWSGPSSPGQLDIDRALPVLFTPTYFDCGHSNKWIISATAPIVEHMPRYTEWRHLRRPTFVGVVVMDIDFEKVDFNSCKVSVGNAGPSFLSGIDRCKKTTLCKHNAGFGFKRGGYRCVCRAGYRYPYLNRGAFRGIDIEQASEEEYNNGFVCLPTDWRIVLPNVENPDYNPMVISRNKREADRNVTVDDESELKHTKKKRMHDFHDFTDPIYSTSSEEMKCTSDYEGQCTHQHAEDIHREKRSVVFDQTALDKMAKIFYQHKSVTAENCHRMKDHELKMQGDVAYGVDVQFEAEARTALRLSNFLSNYLQNVVPGETYGDYREAKRLHVDHLFGEVLANVMANYKIQSSGVYFDAYAFENMDGSAREFFGPYAWRTSTGEYKALDSAGLKQQYIHEIWFQEMKQRWRTNTGGMTKYKQKAYIRKDWSGTHNIKFEFFPIPYWAPTLKHGRWTRPYFKCDGQVDDWIMTYVVPFIGRDQLRKKFQFKGVVTVDVLLSELDINQCPQPFHTANAFKNTARCPPSTQCNIIPDFKFQNGGYMCACKQGYEYPHLDGREWVEGTLLEREFEKKDRGEYSRFDDMKCRVAGTTNIAPPISLIYILFLLIRMLHR